MREFNSIAWYMVRGRKVVTVTLDREEEREGLLSRLQTEGVLVDGIERKIDGVESFAISPLRKGMEIGLRITEESVK